MSTATAILDAHGLTKAFSGNTVLKGLDLQVRVGEFISVMGPSGSGKSTLLFNISGMDTMTSGNVLLAYLAGREPRGELNERARVLYMIDGQIVGDRDQGPDRGDLDQRHAELTEWLVEPQR